MSRKRSRPTATPTAIPVRPVNMPRLRDTCASVLRDISRDYGPGRKGMATLKEGVLSANENGTLNKVFNETPTTEQYEDQANLFGRYATTLRASELFWVTHPMSQLVDGAFETLPNMLLGSALNPTVGGSVREVAECGFLVFESAFENNDPGFAIGYNDAKLRYLSRPLPVRAIAWGPAAGGMLIVTYADTSTVAHQMADDAVMERRERGVVRLGAYRDNIARAKEVARNQLYREYGPLFPMGVGVFALDRELGEPDDPMRSSVLARLLTTWLMMSQPLLSGREKLPPDPRLAQAYARARRPEPTVTMVVLRHKRTGPKEPLDPDREVHTWKYRVPVRGYWRDQWCGPGRTILRPTWVRPHWAGPEDGPVRVREHVNLWRQ